MLNNILNNVSLVDGVFGGDLILFDSVNELFELELALLESQTLSKEELLDRSAFFKTVNGNPTNHYKLCQPFNGRMSQDRSARTQAYFEEGKFSTGYATHGLFPYRGKFHPQLVKGLLNIVSIKPTEIVLDPMCGSGTLNVEASLLGIDSIGLDVSPFCCFMTRVKCQSLSLPLHLVQSMRFDYRRDQVNHQPSLLQYARTRATGAELGGNKNGRSAGRRPPLASRPHRGCTPVTQR